MSRTVVLGLATALVAGGGLLVFLRDMRFVLERRLPESAGGRHGGVKRALLEAALPLVAVVALLSWVWATL